MDGNIVKYQHTQVGRLMLYILIITAFYFFFILTKAEFEPIILAIMLFILFIVASFTSLNVIIDEKYLRIKFGYGIFRKKFTLTEINSTECVKNKWYYGWGIRVWYRPFMIIFNVSGFDAVEIKMKNGKIYRIGTDEPRELESAINREIESLEHARNK